MRVGVFLLVRRSLRQHALATAITAVSAALACGLVMAVFAIEDQTRAAFAARPGEFDAILGPRGSPTQLVLNTVFHLDTANGTVPWSELVALRNDPGVERAEPCCVGDSVTGFRIVATTPEALAGLGLRVAPGGRMFDPARRDVVVGSFVARRTGLRVQSRLHPSHGVGEGAEHHDEYVVTGVLEPTNTPSDRVVWMPLEGYFRMEGHALRGSGTTYVARQDEDVPDSAKEVSAVLLKLRDPRAGFALDEKYNKLGRTATFVWPVERVIGDLFNQLGWAILVLRAVAYLVVVVAAASILASVYNTIQERRREFAILRAIGAHRVTVFSAIVAEAATISAMGALLGFVVYAGIVAAVAAVVRTETGVVIDALRFHPALVLAPLGMVAVGAAAGAVPALKAYATDVATHLAPTT